MSDFLKPPNTLKVLVSTASRRKILLAGVLFSGLLVSQPTLVLAGAGHDHGSNQFQQADSSSIKSVEVDGEMIKRLGLKIEPAKRQRLLLGIKTNGQIESLPNQQVEVTTPAGGTVVQLLVNPGDTVRAGQTVAIMTASELAGLRTEALERRAEAIAAREQAEAELKLAQQNLEQQHKIVTANIQEAKTQMSFAQERYSKDQELFAQGAIPRRTAQESETKLQEAKAVLTRAESALEIAEAQAQLHRAEAAVSLAQKRISLSDETYQRRLQQLGANANADGRIAIKAPISGVIAAQNTTSGESGEDAGKKIMTIVNGSHIQVSANIFEKDIARVRIGQRVRMRVNGLPDRTFAGKIDLIGAVVSSETRIAPVKVTIENGSGHLKPGMFVELEVLTNQTPSAVLAIPKSALVETNDKQQLVFIQNGNAFHGIEVKLGRESGELVEVKDGIFDGDRLVTQRANQLYAQALRGGNKVVKGDHDSSKVEVAPTGTSLPWWLLLSLGGTALGGAFWGGSWWSRQREGGSLEPSAAYQTESHLNPAQPPIVTPSEEILNNPHQPY
jgi:cobalt-zinc-cadmium efflux system membrane fusion protein